MQQISHLLTGNRSPGNQFNDPSSSDIKLTLSFKDGFSVSMNVHRQILVAHSVLRGEAVGEISLCIFQFSRAHLISISASSVVQFKQWAPIGGATVWGWSSGSQRRSTRSSISLGYMSAQVATLEQATIGEAMLKTAVDAWGTVRAASVKSSGMCSRTASSEKPGISEDFKGLGFTVGELPRDETGFRE